MFRHDGRMWSLRARHFSRIILAVSIVLLITSLVLYLGGTGWAVANQKASVLGAVVGAAALLLGLVQELRQQRALRQGAPVDLDRLARQLGETVAAQWLEEERVRGIHDPFPLPLSWTNAPDHLADHWANIHRSPERHDPIDLSGQLQDLIGVFTRIPSRRMVVLGEPGAGKTILTSRFVLDYLGSTSALPVPVIFTVGLVGSHEARVARLDGRPAGCHLPGTGRTH
jgi:hypothetical protein